jgi:hypothetical protein
VNRSEAKHKRITHGSLMASYVTTPVPSPSRSVSVRFPSVPLRSFVQTEGEKIKEEIKQSLCFRVFRLVCGGAAYLADQRTLELKINIKQNNIITIIISDNDNAFRSNNTRELSTRFETYPQGVCFSLHRTSFRRFFLLLWLPSCDVL